MMNHENSDKKNTHSGIDPVDESWALALLNEAMLEDIDHDGSAQGAVAICSSSISSACRGQDSAIERHSRLADIEDELAQEVIVVSETPTAIEKQQLAYQKLAQVKAEAERLADQKGKSWFSRLTDRLSG